MVVQSTALPILFYCGLSAALGQAGQRALVDSAALHDGAAHCVVPIVQVQVQVLLWGGRRRRLGSSGRHEAHVQEDLGRSYLMLAPLSQLQGILPHYLAGMLQLCSLPGLRARYRQPKMNGKMW